MKIESNGCQELREASARVLQELTELAGGKPPRIAAMITYIRDHLFAPGLSVGRIKKECRLRDNSIALRFHREIGVPPGTFITDRRLAVADRLLVDTWLPIWQITTLLGYSSIQVFSRAYLRHRGIRPNEYRRRSLARRPASQAPPPNSVPLPDLLLPALAGQLDDQQAAELIRRLLEIYPPGRRQSLH